MMMDAAAEALLRCGTAEPVPGRRMLRAGALRCTLEAGAVRHLTWRGVEILRGVAYLLRDRNWGTPEAAIEGLLVEQGASGFRAAFTGRVAVGDAPFRYEARISGSAEGSFDFEVAGVAEGAVETNRCGFVVLHPASFAGLPLEVRHTGGSTERTHFPEVISPGQPVFDIRALRYEPGEGVEVTCTLEAELPQDPAGRFEMEDQRNWSDASFKTYVGSLLDHWPYLLEPGRVLRQRVSVRIAEQPAKAGRPVQATADRALRFGQPGTARLPAMGLGVPQGAASLSPQDAAHLARLRPSWLVAAADLAAPGQARQLAAAAALAERCGAQVQLELLVPVAAPPETELAAAADLCRAAGLHPASVLVCPRALLRSYQPSDTWPDLPPLEAFYAAARAAFPAARIGGGMATYFTELNRKRPGGTGIDFISHTTAPIVHAADDLSVMETLQALPHMARSVRAIWPGLGYRIGPSSLAMRSNPYGEATVPNPGGRRVPLADRDPRQAGLFAAAWTIGYAAALAAEGIEMLALHGSHGPSGVLAEGAEHVAWQPLFPDACVLPVFHAMRALAGAAGKPFVPVEQCPDGIAALAWQEAGGVAAIVANLTAEPAALDLPGRWRALCLDVPGFAAAVRDPLWLDGPGEHVTALRLGGYGTAFLRQEPAA